MSVPDQITKFVDLRDFYPDAPFFEIPCSPHLFEPDDWSRITAVAAKKQWDAMPDLEDAVLVNVGIGNGIDLAGAFLRAVRPRLFIGVDYKPEAVIASAALARKQGWPATLLESDLLGKVPKPYLDVACEIRACIPQIPRPEGVDLMEKDNSGHYYDPSLCDPQWNAFGLGLTARLLKQTSQKAPEASISLTLAGRPGLERLKNMFRECGYIPEVCHEEIFRQHAGTDIGPLVDLERNGLKGIEFFSDPEGRNVISAAEANERRLSPNEEHHPYHRGFVLTAPRLR